MKLLGELISYRLLLRTELTLRACAQEGQPFTLENAAGLN